LRAKQNTAGHCRRFGGQCRISATTKGDLPTHALIADALTFDSDHFDGAGQRRTSRNGHSKEILRILDTSSTWCLSEHGAGIFP
jgi:hypothetical protein